MAGLFDILQGGGSPEQDQMATAVAQGLLSANGSQGLGNAMGLLNASKMDILKQRDLAQQIQLRNIGLQQQQQEWAAIQPALAAYAARQAGGAPATSAASQPAIPPMAGGPLGSGTAGIDIGGQPARSAAPAGAPSVSGASGASDPFSMDNLIQGRLVNMFGQAPAAAAFWERFKPTDMQRNDTYLGIGQDQSRTSELAKRFKEGYIPPTRLAPGVYSDPVAGIQGLPAPPQPGFQNVKNPDGTWSTLPVGNGPAAVRTAAGAKTAGEGDYTPYAGVTATGAPAPITNRTLAATQGSLGAPTALDDPNVPPTTPYQRAGSDVASIQREIAGVNRSMVPAATKKMQLDILNQELVKAQAGTQPQTQTQPALGAQPGALYATPPLGTVTNADASQKAPAQTMHDSYSKLQANGSTANSAIDALDKMMGLAANKNPLLTAGMLGTNQSAVNPSAAEYEKQRANVISLMSQQLGAGGTDAGRANIAESVPDFGKPKSAIADGLTTLRNQLVAAQIKRDLLTPVFQAGDSKKYTTLENQFDQNVSPALVPLLTMQPGPQRAAALKAAAQHPEIKARLNWAAENGLLK